MKQVLGWSMAALLACELTPAGAADFSAWSHRMPITFSGYSKAETLTNFPLVVSLGAGIAGFDYADFGSPANGADLRFTADNQTDELAYEIERWNTNGTSVVWVQVPRVENATTRIHAFWGRAGQAAPVQATNGAAWSQGYAGVWHLGESSGSNRDSTTNGNHATIYNGAVQGAAGQVGGAVSLDGVNDYLAVVHNAGLALTNDFTAEVLVCRTTDSAFDGFVSKSSAAAAGWNLNFNDNTNKFAAYVGPTNAGYINVDGAATSNDFNWHHMALRIQNGTANIFFDGLQQSASVNAVVIDSNQRIVFGAFYAATVPTHFLNGLLDEVRISRVPRSADWLWASWANQMEPATLLEVGPATNGTLRVQALPAVPFGPGQSTLSGRLINDGGADTAITFCWDEQDRGAGATGDWARAVTVAGPWRLDDLFSGIADGLVPGGGYVYRCFAANTTGGTAWSEPQAFTAVNFATVTNVSAVALPRGARLTAEITDISEDTPATWFRYWIDGQAVTTSVAVGRQAGAFSATVAGLQAGSTYSFVAVASNAMGAVSSETGSFVPLNGVTTVWTGSGQDWNDATRWGAGVVPGDGHDVVINGNVMLTNSPAVLSSFTVNAGATNTFGGWETVVTAAVVTVNGTITHLPNTDTVGTLGAYPGGWTPDNRVQLVCRELLVAATGLIDANEKGYGSNTGAVSTAYGPGGARNSSGGAGYGGIGGYGTQPASWGLTYGSLEAPEDPGSGGRGNSAVNQPGGWGGGAVRIVADGAVTVNGTIRANGGAGLGANYRGAGSGGSLFITCGTFEGETGVLWANGGAVTVGTTGGGGGGGRIAVIVTDHAAQRGKPAPSVSCLARAGVRSYANDNTAGQPGSLFLNTAYLDVSTLGEGSLDAESGWFANGETVALEATPVPGQRFVQWSGSGVPAGAWTQNPLTVTMDMNRTIQANFTLDAPVARTWQGRGNWFSVTNWIPNGIPGPQDTVIIDSGTNKTAVFTAYLADPVTVGSLTISNAFLVFTNWTTCLTAGDVSVLTGGVMTLPAAFRDTGLPNTLQAPMSNRIDIVCANLVVERFGQINADGKGYNANQTGYYAGGPGSTRFAAGPSHGGRGATRNITPALVAAAPAGPLYGSAEEPDQPGSGANSSNGSDPGGAGGGLIRVSASEAIIINGAVTANGNNGLVNYGHGGSGGGINLSCRTFAGTNGVVSAQGGNGSGGTCGAGGGGGRIAIHYDPVYQQSLPPPAVLVSAKPGKSGKLGTNFHSYRDNAELGSVFVPDTRWLTETVSTFINGQLCFGSEAMVWSVNTLTISNGWMEFPAGFEINVTNEMTVTAGPDTTVKVRVGIPNGTLTCGSLMVTNSTGLFVYAGLTNDSTGLTGALVRVAGQMTLATNCAVYPVCDQTNGGAVVFRVRDLVVEANAAIDATGAGFYDNNGPGAGYLADSSWCKKENGGGGHGGRGGRATVSQIGGATYGDSNAPIRPGSGGAGNGGLRGGGVVWLEASGRVQVDGSIVASGLSGSPAQNAGVADATGAGGGIFLRCDTLSGGGLLLAAGGSNGSTNAAAGGGGRIAVERRKGNFTISQCQAPGGVAATGGLFTGEDGTVVWTNLRGAGTLILVR